MLALESDNAVTRANKLVTGGADRGLSDRMGLRGYDGGAARNAFVLASTAPALDEASKRKLTVGTFASNSALSAMRELEFFFDVGELFGDAVRMATREDDDA